MHVLIIDDHERLAESIGALLAPEIRSSFAASVDAAIVTLSREPPDCVLVDLAMPGGGGIAVYRWLRATLPCLARRTVFMTGFSEEIARDALGDIPNPVLLKPFAHQELVATLQLAATAA